MCVHPQKRSPSLQGLDSPLASCVALTIAPLATAAARKNCPLALSLGFTVIEEFSSVDGYKVNHLIHTYML